MKRWILCAFATSLAGCSQGGAASASVMAMCGAESTPASAMSPMSAQGLNGFSDPFETRGKVIIGESAETDSNGFTPASTKSANKIAAGTELTVSLKESCQASGEISKQIRSAAHEEKGSITPAGVRSYTYQVPADLTVAELSAAADADDCVAGISEETKLFPRADYGADPLIPEQGHLKMMEAAAGFNFLNVQSATAAPVTIAVIDTGIDVNHEDLKNVLWKNSDEIPNNRIDDDHNGYVDDVNGYNFANNVGSPSTVGTWSVYHHGTHVSGLAAAQGGNGVGVTGIMGTGARIMMLNVFGGQAGAASSAIANAIRYAADNGADVINMSVGGSGRNASYEAALGYAISKGATVVAAAGNERRELGSSYFMSPGSYGAQFPGMVNVGSVDSSDLSFSTFSNYSPTLVEVGAPGAEDSSARRGVLSTMPNGRYARIQGTSMASPVAAGTAAFAISLLRSKGYRPTPATVEGVMTVSSRSLDHLRTKIKEGRVLNLKLLAEFIDHTYPNVSGGGDPGVPGYVACAQASK